METFDTIQKRRSVRSYKPDLIPDEMLDRVLEAGQLAPTAKNSQSFKLVIVKDKVKIIKIAELSGQTFIGEAPVIIIFVSTDPESVMNSGVPRYAVDTGIVVDHMTLMAADLGLGTCWIGGFSPEGMKELLGIPGNHKISALLPIGYANDLPKVKSRKGLEEIVCFDSFY